MSTPPSLNAAHWYFSGKPTGVRFDTRAVYADDTSARVAHDGAQHVAQVDDVWRNSTTSLLGARAGGPADALGGARSKSARTDDGTNTSHFAPARPPTPNVEEVKSEVAVAHATKPDVEAVASCLVRDRTLLPAISKAINSAPFDESNALGTITDLLYNSLEKPSVTDVETLSHDELEVEVKIDEDDEADEADKQHSVSSPILPAGSRLAFRSAGPFVSSHPILAPPAAPVSRTPPSGYKPKPPTVYTTSTGKTYSICTDEAFRARPRFDFLPQTWFLMTASRGTRRHHDVCFVKPDRKTYYWHKVAAVAAVHAWNAARTE